MEKGEREVRERKGRGGRRGEGEKGGNGSGPDHVREENDARVHTPIFTSNIKTIGLLPTTYNV